MTTTKRKLIRIASFPKIMADCHQVEGTRLFVLELVMVGFAFSSYYLLLRSRSLAEKLNDEKVGAEVAHRPTKFGRKLRFGLDLEVDPATKDIYYLGPVKERDLIVENA